MKASIKKRYLLGRLESTKVGSTKVYRREVTPVKSLDTRVLGPVATPKTKSA